MYFNKFAPIQSGQPQHVEPSGTADYLLRFREAAVVGRNQNTAVQEMARELGGGDPIAILVPRLGSDQDVVRLHKAVKVLGSPRLDLVGLRGWYPFVAGPALVDCDDLAIAARG